jgi:aryl-alcohol dehydrogenase-like predicted oxidoreductase
VEIFTKVYFPTGPGRNDRGLSRKHIQEGINASLRRLNTDYGDLYQAHRFDYATPLEETMEALADVVHAGKALYLGVSEWTPEEIRRAAELARELKVRLVSNQPQYNMLWRVIDAEVDPTCRGLGIPRSSGHPWPRACSPASTGRVSNRQRAHAPPMTKAAGTWWPAGCVTMSSPAFSSWNPWPPKQA